MYAAWTRKIERIERNVDRAASALLAAACGYAAFAWFRLTARQPVLWGETAAAAAAAYFIGVRILRLVKPAARKAPVPIFDVRNVEPPEAAEVPAPEAPEELLLEELAPEAPPSPGEAAAQASAPPQEASDAVSLSAEPEEEPLLLDDIVAEIGVNSRVVRLFDREAMPTAGELKSRIERHLDGEAAAAQSIDASQALHDALAELRRSIR